MGQCKMSARGMFAVARVLILRMQYKMSARGMFAVVFVGVLSPRVESEKERARKRARGQGAANSTCASERREDSTHSTHSTCTWCTQRVCRVTVMPPWVSPASPRRYNDHHRHTAENAVALCPTGHHHSLVSVPGCTSANL